VRRDNRMADAREKLRAIEEATVDGLGCGTPLARRRAETPILERTYLGQIQPAPLGLRKQPTDCGRNHFGNHSTTSGNNAVKAMVMKNTT